jgi:hypothetical protein
MQISWSGYGCFRLQEGAATVIFDPTFEPSDFKLRKTNADLLVLSHEKTKEDLACVGDETFVIDSPGEYEIKNVFVNGLGNGLTSSVYRLDMESITVAWIGPVKAKDLTSSVIEGIDGVDILLIPIGGGEMMNAKEAAALINQLEPRIVIPSYYKISGSKGLEPLETFIKEYSAPQETVDKFKITKKDLQSEDTKVIVLTA